METYDIIRIMSYVLPASVALMCFLLLARERFVEKNHRIEKGLTGSLMGFYALTMFCWMMTLFDFYMPKVYVYLHLFLYLYIAFNLFYIGLALLRLKRYRIIYTICIFMMPMPLITPSFAQCTLTTALILLCWRILPIWAYAFLCYKLLSGRYVLVVPDTPVGEEKTEKDAASMLKRATFDKYMHTHKPYLDPGLKITDLLLPFHTNRQYFSAFINREYGMNFSSYINTLRLKEMERIRDGPGNASLGEVELALKAGFGSYRSYKDFKKRNAHLT